MNSSPRHAFTLVELSIVLVILGLLVGGVLAGQSLIRASELRAVSSEFQRYQTALGVFKDKYFAIPGDMPNAVKYWGAQAGATTDGKDATCAALAVAATGIATCNGDGDGSISNAAVTNSYEMYRAWQHLANAGLVEGSFSAITGPLSAYNSVVGTNVPRSKLSGAGWSLWGMGTYAADANYFGAAYGNSLWFGGAWTVSISVNPILRPEEAYNIDMKMDDGKPNTGKILQFKYAIFNNCANATNDAYALSITTVTCPMIFITGY